MRFYLSTRSWLAFRNEVLQSPDGRQVLFSGCPPLNSDWISVKV